MKAAAASSTGSDVMALALVLALAAHAAAITMVHFDWMTVRPGAVPPSLDVILVDWASEQPPDEADFLAQATQRGGGESPDRERPVEPPAAAEPDPGESLAAAEPEPVPSPAETGDVVAVPDPDAEPVLPPAEDAAAPEVPDARRLVSESLALARHAPDRLAEARELPERPRRKVISANTQEHLYASYMRAWVAKVERVGNMNYPEQARRANLEGSLVLSVDVLQDGSIEHIRVLRSSGFEVLDEAAVRIVRLAAPYAPLPEEIRRDVDVLTITRTWQFSARRGLE